MVWQRCLLVAISVAACGGAFAEPVRPRDDATVLLTVPASQSRATSELRQARAGLSRNRDDLAAALRVARLAIDQGRTWSDPRRYGEAQAALSPWWSESRPPEATRVLRAVIKQALHDFPAALTELDAVLETSPGNAQARLTRAFVRLVVGDIAGAREDCRKLPRAIGLLPAAACRARVAALSGSGAEAYRYLARFIARDRAQPQAMQRFALVILADIAQGIGRDDDAERNFLAAIAIGQPDVPLLAAMADHLLDLNRAADVLTLLADKGDADVLLLRRAIAARRTNDPRLAQWSATLNQRFAAAKQAGSRLHLREEARFRLEVEANAVIALPLAIENWSIQKEIVDAGLLLECADAAGRPAAAGDVLRFVQRTGLTDHRIMQRIARLREAAQ
jgi:hypothetical protein